MAVDSSRQQADSNTQETSAEGTRICGVEPKLLAFQKTLILRVFLCGNFQALKGVFPEVVWFHYTLTRGINV